MDMKRVPVKIHALCLDSVPCSKRSESWSYLNASLILAYALKMRIGWSTSVTRVNSIKTKSLVPVCLEGSICGCFMLSLRVKYKVLHYVKRSSERRMMTDVWTVHSDTNSMAQPSLKSHLKATVANIVSINNIFKQCSDVIASTILMK